MLKNNKWKLLISSIIILIPSLFGIIVKDRLTNNIGFRGGYWVLLVMPVILLAIHWGCILLNDHINKNNEQNKKVVTLVLFIIPAISVYVCGMMYAILFGLELNYFALVCALLGVAFIVMGNYMPKTTRNATLGIKIKWTLANDENWVSTHRFCGRIWVVLGIVLALCAFLPSALFPFICIAAILVGVSLPVIYSYRFYKKQLREGKATKEDYKTASVYSKKSAWIVIPIVTAIVILCVVLCFTGDVKTEFGDTSFTVKASYWSDVTLDYAEIDSIEYRENGVSGERINGFASPRLLVGWFRGEELGNYTRYTYTSDRACVVLTVDGEFFVINGKSADATRDIYERLSAEINK